MERQTLHTAEDLLRLSAQGRYELVKGELIEMPPAGGRHGQVAMRIGIRLGAYVERQGLGEVFAAETGFYLAHRRDTVRAPDAAFVSRGRLPAGPAPEGYIDLTPDLAVEVVSPSDTASAIQAKVEDWLRAGTRLVWVVYPETRSVAVYGSLADVRILREGESLDGGEVVPGFSCPLAEIL